MLGPSGHHPSWDFLEAGHSSVLALHIGQERDYFCLHDSRCQRPRGVFSSMAKHSLTIHSSSHGPTDLFGLACFVNEQTVATTTTSSSSVGQGAAGGVDCVINLWDTRYGREPVSGLAAPLIPSFPHGDAVLEDFRPLSLPRLLKSKSSSRQAISHIKAIDNGGRLHVITRVPAKKGHTAKIQQNHHWIVDLVSGNTRQITTQPQEFEILSEIDTIGHTAPFAFQHSGGLLACASFHENVVSYDNGIEIAFHDTTAAATLTTTTAQVTEKVPCHEQTKKRKHTAQTPRNCLSSAAGVVGRLFPKQVVDEYGLATPITHLTWNATGTHLVGISANSDLHVWGAY
jgi:hypothetical protein